jgi:DNA primase
VSEVKILIGVQDRQHASAIRASQFMPGIDYAKVRLLVAMADVLRLIEFEGVETQGDEIRGPCPIHGSKSARSRSFSANIRKNTFRCFKCAACGNQLDLWAAVSKLPLYEAARDLCDKAGVEVPIVHRW